MQPTRVSLSNKPTLRFAALPFLLCRTSSISFASHLGLSAASPAPFSQITTITRIVTSLDLSTPLDPNLRNDIDTRLIAQSKHHPGFAVYPTTTHTLAPATAARSCSDKTIGAASTSVITAPWRRQLA
ncbi:uncharacterized protein PAN0_006d2864 [Moesziomyces antarcticus]|uniref:Uncharacterized protein n=2 Tax=Pseudozyma antarctica TaxID=84753 RepID=A0A5C3FMM4_PSEA2|nr:uncharacterized protein PAN0_006d2864 [Moesziomyces antarcticus]GAK64650.1 hypothetical protein PAN0_006d2864 [Moesziomyces antarcticus]SPO45632.1 uncharacterized protein PSANT_03318 [Moesziomyces antarcticus]